MVSVDLRLFSRLVRFLMIIIIKSSLVDTRFRVVEATHSYIEVWLVSQNPIKIEFHWTRTVKIDLDQITCPCGRRLIKPVRTCGRVGISIPSLHRTQMKYIPNKPISHLWCSVDVRQMPLGVLRDTRLRVHAALPVWREIHCYVCSTEMKYIIITPVRCYGKDPDKSKFFHCNLMKGIPVGL